MNRSVLGIFCITLVTLLVEVSYANSNVDFVCSYITPTDAAKVQLSLDAKVIECQQKFQTNKCEEFKSTLSDQEKENVLDCNNITRASGLDLAVSCGEGIVDFVVDTAKGAVTLIKAAPGFIASIPSMTYNYSARVAGALADTADWLKRCETDLNLRSEVFAPVAMLFSEKDQKNIIENTSCEGLSQFVSLEYINANKRIAEKKSLQERFLSIYPERQIPAHLVVTPGENEFLVRQAERSDAQYGESLVQKAWDQAKGRLQCYTPQAQAEVACAIIAEVAGTYLTGGAVTAARRSATINNIVKTSVNGIKGTKAGSAVAVREGYLTRNLDLAVTTPAQNAKWVQTADKVTSKDGYKFLEVENSMMKNLNDDLKDKNLVTSLTNRHKELTLEEVQKIVEKNPGLVVDSYSDFKSVRFAFSGKVPPDIEAQLNIAFSKANTSFSKEVKDQKIVPDNTKPEEWFRAGMGDTADEASNVARVARKQGSTNSLLSINQPGVKSRLSSDLQTVEFSRKGLEENWGRTALMSGPSGKKVPNSEVFEILRKSSDPAVVSKEVKRRLGVSNFSEKDAIDLITYSKSVDAFNPSLRIVKRDVNNLDEAQFGGFSADFGGLGAQNNLATAKALAGEADYSAALVAARNGEKAVTTEIKSRMEVFNRTVGDVAKCSGDDCIGLAKKPLTTSDKAGIVSSLAGNDSTRAIRIAFVNPGVKEASHRTLLSTHGESIEKILRQEIAESIPFVRSKDFTFGIDMKTTKLNSGNVDVYIGSRPGATVTAAEQKAIKEALARAVQKFNSDMRASGTKSTYKAP